MRRLCADDVLVNDWHAVADLAMLKSEAAFATCLLGVQIEIRRLADGGIRVVRTDLGTAVHSSERYGLVFACLGTPARDIPAFAEAEEDDRYHLTGGSIGVKVSGLRAVENFLDMGHFPFVHTGWLGIEPHTEVEPYKVEVTADDEVLATECKFFQPVASPTATGGMMVDYIYKVLRPYTVCLYKSNPIQTHRLDLIVLFVQPVDEEHCIAHSYLAYIKDNMTEGMVRWFMQLIFAQDKPILENQLPKRLPLDPRAETPIRADAVSVYYRRWLKQKGVTYGAIPAAA
jgi:phenylpropionate dioxygenase-like ring-hydroxylating dioxygenase large terminal subunit